MLLFGYSLILFFSGVSIIARRWVPIWVVLGGGMEHLRGVTWEVLKSFGDMPSERTEAIVFICFSLEHIPASAVLYAMRPSSEPSYCWIHALESAEL